MTRNTVTSDIIYIFIDLEKEFDSIHRESSWNIIARHEVPQNIDELMKSTQHNGLI